MSDHRMRALGLVGVAIVAVQVGAAIATHLFDEIGFEGAVALRLLLAAPILILIWRPNRDLLRHAGLMTAILLGLALAAMNFSFYAAIDRIPLGSAVTLEFIGPLAVTVATAHRRVALLWAALAAIGVVALTGGIAGNALDGLGVAFALIAGACWAGYILLTERIGRQFTGGEGLAVAISIAAIVTLPPGLVVAGGSLISWEVLGIGLAVALLASAIPYSAELSALRTIRAETFGVLMSAEPAVAALVGFALLGQGLAFHEAAGIACVVLASVGAIRTAPPQVPIGPGT